MKYFLYTFFNVFLRKPASKYMCIHTESYSSTAPICLSFELTSHVSSVFCPYAFICEIKDLHLPKPKPQHACIQTSDEFILQNISQICVERNNKF